MRQRNEQDIIQRLLRDIDNEVYEHRARISVLEKRKTNLIQIGHSINDPHALIPKQFASIEDWLKECESFPEHIIGMIFMNKMSAIEVSYVCNTYQRDYHVVKCKDKEFYYNEFVNE